MNYQGVGTRKDMVWLGIVLWIMVSWYPFLSMALIGSLFVSTYWETTASGVRVAVNLFRGKVTDPKGQYEKNITMTRTAVLDSAEPATDAEDSNPNRKRVIKESV